MTYGHVHTWEEQEDARKLADHQRGDVPGGGVPDTR